MPRVGIVIRTLNEAALLAETLTAIAEQASLQVELVLVDSGSTDETLSIARAHCIEKIIEIPSCDFTYGYALNLGVSELTDDVEYVVMLSAHSVPCHSEWLRKLLEPFEADSAVQGVYGKQLPFPAHLTNRVVRGLAAGAYPDCYGDVPGKTRTSPFFSNANSAIRRSAWRKHPFDETLPGCEDGAWAREVQSCGGWIAYQPEASVYHSHPDSAFDFFRRVCAEEHAGHLIDPEGFPIQTLGVAAANAWAHCRHYVRNVRATGTFTGMHFDRLHTDLLCATSTYAGRRRASPARNLEEKQAQV